MRVHNGEEGPKVTQKRPHSRVQWFGNALASHRMGPQDASSLRSIYPTIFPAPVARIKSRLEAESANQMGRSLERSRRLTRRLNCILHWLNSFRVGILENSGGKPRYWHPWRFASGRDFQTALLVGNQWQGKERKNRKERELQAQSVSWSYSYGTCFRCYRRSRWGN